MKPRFEKLTSTDIITALIVIALFAVPLLLLFVDSALPETMIGEEGLRQTRAYLLRFVCVSVIHITVTAIVVIGYLVMLIKLKKEPLKNKIISGIISVIFLVMISGIFSPKCSKVDVQGERFSRIPAVHAIRLLYVIEQDLHSDPVEMYADADLSSMTQRFMISSGGRGSRASYAIEYKLLTAVGTTICQLTKSDFQALKPYIESDSTHQVMCYPHSGMLYALDHGEVTRDTALSDEDYYASQYTLTYDEDGYLRWSPVGHKLTLVILCDSERHLGWNADGKSEYKPFFVQGHENTAYLEAVVPGHGYTRVSNIITTNDPYIEETTEYVPPSFTGECIPDGEGKVHCTLTPYGVSVDLPEELNPEFTDLCADKTLNGAECTLLRGECSYMEFEMEWEYTRFLASTKWGLEDIGTNFYQYKYDGCIVEIEELNGFDEAYFMWVRPGRNKTLKNTRLYAIAKVKDDEYVRLCITYADSQSEVSAKEILDSFIITEK